MRVFLISVVHVTILLLSPLTTASASVEGVQVHGHWTLTVLNADGSLDRRISFDNALTQNGSSHLIRLLSRQATTQKWSIGIIGGGGFESPCDVNGQAQPCYIHEPGTVTPDPNLFETLLVGSNNPDNPSMLVLSGSLTVGEIINNPKGIHAVETRLFLCDWISGQDCSFGNFGSLTFTEKVLDAPVPVVPSQIVQIRVEISFS